MNDSYLSPELLDTAADFVRNGGNVSREVKDRILIAMSLDNHYGLVDVVTKQSNFSKRLKKLEDYFKFPPKRAAKVFAIFLGISSIYIKESRDAMLGLIAEILQLL